jgi:probable rRNA maturation factor
LPPPAEAAKTFRPVIACSIRAAGWRLLLPRAKPLAAKAILAALRTAGIAVSAAGDRPLEISLVLADDAFVRALNRDYRGQDKATNVLSFPALEKSDLKRLLKPKAKQPSPPQDLPLGDIILALETIEREAEAAGKSIKDHFYHLVVHGLLHLIGYDHVNDIEAEKMERLETAILASISVSNPYATKTCTTKK